MSAEEKASAAADNYNMPNVELTPAGKRVAAEESAAANAGPDGRMSVAYKEASKKGDELAEIQRIATSRIIIVESAHDTIERYKGSTRTSGARRTRQEMETLTRIQQSVGAKSTGRSALVQAIRKKFIKDTR